MDDMVRAALAKWPNVPDCFGWLSLDLRGHWRLGSERQNVANAAINAFIGRNYGKDDQGRWLFQNGPQRVFVALDYTPFVWKMVPSQLGSPYVLQNHVGAQAGPPTTIWLDEQGRFLIEADQMIGVLHDHDAQLMLDLFVTTAQGTPDLERFARDLEDKGVVDESIAIQWSNTLTLPLRQISSDQVASRFHFVAAPEPASAN